MVAKVFAKDLIFFAKSFAKGTIPFDDFKTSKDEHLCFGRNNYLLAVDLLKNIAKPFNYWICFATLFQQDVNNGVNEFFLIRFC
jgi:hypothetical protein